MGSAVRAPGKEHMPNYPKGWITIRILQLIVAVVILGLCSYLVTTSVIGAGFYVQIFTAVCTIITSIWLISAHSCAPRAFNYWAVLVLDIYQYVLWLGGFAACAILAAGLFGGRDLSNNDYGFRYLHRRYYYSWYDDDRYTTTNAALGAAAAGLGAIEFLFFFICLVVDSVVIHRHRRAGLHSRPVRHIGGGGSVMMMPPQQPSTYQAVPQTGTGVPFTQQDTAYNPQGGMYGTPPPQQQQGIYAGQGYAHPQQQQPQTSYYAPAPMMPQHTGTSYHKTVSPVPAQQAVAYPPPQQQPPHNSHYTG